MSRSLPAIMHSKKSRLIDDAYQKLTTDHVVSFVFSLVCTIKSEHRGFKKPSLGPLKILLAIPSHCPSLLSLHIAAFDGFALVIAFLALTESNDELNVAATGEELRGDNGIAVLLASSELLDLPPLR